MLKRIALWLAAALAIAVYVAKLLWNRGQKFKALADLNESRATVNYELRKSEEEVLRAEAKQVIDINNTHGRKRLATLGNRILFGGKVRKAGHTAVPRKPDR